MVAAVKEANIPIVETTATSVPFAQPTSINKSVLKINKNGKIAVLKLWKSNYTGLDQVAADTAAAAAKK